MRLQNKVSVLFIDSTVVYQWDKERKNINKLYETKAQLELSLRSCFINNIHRKPVSVSSIYTLPWLLFCQLETNPKMSENKSCLHKIGL